jgi:hypothetical protein
MATTRKKINFGFVYAYYFGINLTDSQAQLPNQMHEKLLLQLQASQVDRKWIHSTPGDQNTKQRFESSITYQMTLHTMLDKMLCTKHPTNF